MGSAQLFRYPCGDRIERLVKSGSVGTACLSKIRSPSTFTTNLQGYGLDEVARLDFANIIFGHASRQVDLTAVDRAQNDHRAL